MKIDIRDRLIDLINQDNCPSPYICDEKCKYLHLEQCIGDRLADHLIENDVIPVVRCKDCKHYDIRNARCLLHSELADQYSSGFNFEMYSNDYCSYGERKL